MSARVPAAPEGGFVLALVTRHQPTVELGFRAYSADFSPSDVLGGTQGRYTPFSEDEADSMLIHGFGTERTTPWERFADDGYCGPFAEWGAVIQPNSRAGWGS